MLARRFTFTLFLILPITVHSAAIPEKPSSTVPSSHDEEITCDSFVSDEDTCSQFWADSSAPLILISADGFRPEYLTRIDIDNSPIDSNTSATPTLRTILKCGVHAPHMMPSFPTITFPNHYTIVTGLYPESHGIVANDFFDPELNANFSIRYPNARHPQWWKSGEPIWSTVRRQGKVSATFFWPGSDVTDEQKQPNYWKRYNKTIPFEDRVDQVLRWMDLPSHARPVFTSLYFEEPDTTGHRDGPESANVTRQIAVIDRHIARLLNGLQQRNILGCVNIVIVSDHGMAPSPAGENLVDLEPLIPDLEDVAKAYYGPVTAIYPHNVTEGDFLEDITTIGEALECQHPRMRVFTKWDLPYRHHYSKSPRIAPIVLDLDQSWRAVFRQEPYVANGNHGWDNLNPEMQAIFLAIGPSLKKQFIVEPFANVELYNLMCALVNVTPADNEGTSGMLNHLLLDHELTNEVEIVSAAQYPVLHFPQDERTFKQNMQREKCGIISSTGSVATAKFVNITETSSDEYLNYHAPWNVPRSKPEENVHLLVTPNYITGFDVSNGLPLWSQFTVTGVADDANFTSHIQIAQDPRLQRHHRSICDRLNYPLTKDIRLVPLYHPALSSNNTVLLDTNVIEVPARAYPVWQTMLELLSFAAADERPINVITGPTRSRFAGLFYVFTACRVNSTSPCPPDEIDMQSFILPVKTSFNDDCMSDEDFIAFNVASLKDVEQITKLEFFPELPRREKLKLLQKTTSASKLIVDPLNRLKNSN